ncbi:MAG: ABC transporter ATP-binding protein [Verrucomicrobiales bacterium]
MPIKSKAFSSLAATLRFLKRYRGQVFLCLFLLLANIAIEMYLPQIIGDAVTNMQWQVEWGASFDIYPHLYLFLSLVLVRACIGRILGPTRNRVVHNTLSDIRSAIYDAMQKLSFSFHDKTSSGELISRSTTDVWRLQDFYFACLLMVVDTVVSLVVIHWLIFHISVLLGFITLGTVLPTLVLLALYARKLQPEWRKVHDLHGQMTTVVQENIAGVRVVKAFAREQGELNKFTAKRDNYIATLMKTVNYWSSRVPFAQFLFGLGLPLVLWAGGRQVIQRQIELGELIKAIFYLMAIGHRMGAVGQFANIIQNASASAERVLEIINEPRKIRSGSLPFPSESCSVRFDRVCFAYAEGKKAVENVSFEADAGKTYALVGPTGSGKSSLVQLIARYYEPDSGDIFIDGINIRELDLPQLRRNVAIIFQETFLFSASVSENIAYGRPDAAPEEIRQAARLAQADEFISKLEHGYDTVIGERGVTLSGGQKQRIAIARAFIMNPKILILDDATASVDSHTEKLIQEGIRALTRGRTTFIIAHRFSTVQHADQILVLKGGSLVEQGTHQQLIARSGYYSELFQNQLSHT